MTKPNNEIVVLLHGIGHAAPNMIFIEQTLKKSGYAALNLTYPSLKKDIKANGQWLHMKLKQKDVWGSFNKVHFVCHSMGGLVAGFYLQDYKSNFPNDKVGRVVMLGTPHGGSEVADLLHELPPYKWAFGPAGQELTTASRKSNQISPWYDLGIIAGNETWLHPFSFVIKEDQDGCVSVQSTKLPGMKDHIIVSVSHSFMGWSPAVHDQTLHFLQAGVFNHGQA